ncbi:MAG: hypothetical protein H7840_00630 [Alphaproteobacteria bacterium]
MFRGSSVVAVLSLMAACTPMHWERPGSTPASVNQDLDDCRVRASRQAWVDEWFYAPPTLGWSPYPYRQYPYPYGPYYSFGRSEFFFREQNLTTFCMEAKGYRLAPDETAGTGHATPPPGP